MQLRALVHVGGAVLAGTCGSATLCCAALAPTCMQEQLEAAAGEQEGGMEKMRAEVADAHQRLAAQMVTGAALRCCRGAMHCLAQRAGQGQRGAGLACSCTQHTVRRHRAQLRAGGMLCAACAVGRRPSP